VPKCGSFKASLTHDWRVQQAENDFSYHRLSTERGVSVRAHNGSHTQRGMGVGVEGEGECHTDGMGVGVRG
jgi:hypothetical protein